MDTLFRFKLAFRHLVNWSDHWACTYRGRNLTNQLGTSVSWFPLDVQSVSWTSTSKTLVETIWFRLVNAGFALPTPTSKFCGTQITPVNALLALIVSSTNSSLFVIPKSFRFVVNPPSIIGPVLYDYAVSWNTKFRNVRLDWRLIK